MHRVYPFIQCSALRPSAYMASNQHGISIVPRISLGIQKNSQSPWFHVKHILARDVLISMRGIIQRECREPLMRLLCPPVTPGYTVLCAQT